MLLSLRNDHKEHLNLLIKQPVQVVIDFCKLAINFLQNGPDLKLYNTAAQKLEVDPTTIQNCVYGLVNLLLESCKYNLNEADFRDSILTLGFSQEQQAVLSKFYQSKKNEVSGVLEKLTINDLHYNNLDWRFEVQIASRCLLHQINPIITMDLSLKRTHSSDENDKPEHILLQTDPTTLVHITEELERCLNESRSRHSRRVQKAFSSNQ